MTCEFEAIVLEGVAGERPGAAGQMTLQNVPETRTRIIGGDGVFLCDCHGQKRLRVVLRAPPGIIWGNAVGLD